MRRSQLLVAIGEINRALNESRAEEHTKQTFDALRRTNMAKKEPDQGVSLLNALKR